MTISVSVTPRTGSAAEAGITAQQRVTANAAAALQRCRRRMTNPSLRDHANAAAFVAFRAGGRPHGGGWYPLVETTSPESDTQNGDGLALLWIAMLTGKSQS